ncbi:MAG: magnesium transporter [Candidatus Bathyarchaeia archaeon]
MRLANIVQGNVSAKKSLPTPFRASFVGNNVVNNRSPFSNSKFFGVLRQSLMAYAFNLFGIAAGTVIAYNIGVFKQFPWTIAIYPPILSARGVIGGLFCGRLSTGLHLGTIQPSFFGNTKNFHLLFRAVVVLTLEASMLMGLVASLFISFYMKIALVEILNILVVMIATMALALAIISPLSMTVSFLSFKHGLDPDIILYPIESTVADVLITLTYVGVVNAFTVGFVGQFMLAFTCFALAFCAVFFLLKSARESEFLKTIKESLLTITFVSFVVNVAGSTLGKISEVVEEKGEIYVVYPALIDTIGDVGSVVGSTATTKLALGTLKSSFSSIKSHSTEIFGAWTASIIMYCAYSVLALIIQGVFNPSSLIGFTMLLLIANLMAASCIIIVSYAVAILTYQKGLDPDNFEIPVESSMADAITSISLLAAIFLVG